MRLGNGFDSRIAERRRIVPRLIDPIGLSNLAVGAATMRRRTAAEARAD